jgi:hypothetical protein
VLAEERERSMFLLVAARRQEAKAGEETAAKFNHDNIADRLVTRAETQR